jgi:hypothetical protein
MSGEGSTPRIPQTTPQSAPRISNTNNFVAFTVEQLEELTRRIATATAETLHQMPPLTQTTDGTTVVPAPVRISTKDLKLTDPPSFTGRAEDLEPLLRDCEIRFSIQNDIYNTVDKKAYFLLTLFKSGTAKIWKEQYIQSREGHRLVFNDDWEAFKTLLRSAFPEVGRAQDAMKELQNIKQGKMSIDELNTKFRLLVQKAGMNPVTNVAILIALYEQAINRQIAQQIIVAGTPNTLDRYMAKASELDNAFRRANRLFSNAITKGSNHRHKPKYYHSSYAKEEDQGGPMDIDRLDPKEAERRKEKRLCYECGQPGHFASEHRKNNGGNNHQKTYQNNHNNTASTSRQRPTFQGQKFQGKKGKAPQKRMEPEKLRHHIRTLINENFEPESAEYEEFVREVEEKGF